MREILFRGKRTDNGEWVYGNYCNVEYIGGGGYEYFIIEIGEDGGQFRIDPETVGQYAGLKDKNGTKIFENDIISAKKDDYEEYLFSVKFGNCGGVQNVKHPVGYVGFFFEGADAYTKASMKYGHRDDIVYHLNEYECEVVGNVHDNSGLLNQSGS